MCPSEIMPWCHPHLWRTFPSSSLETSLETHLKLCLTKAWNRFIFSFVIILFLITWMWENTWMQLPTEVRGEARSSGARITGGSEPPNVVLGTKLRSSGRATHYILKHWAISPDPTIFIGGQCMCGTHHHTAVEIQGYLVGSVLLFHLCMDSGDRTQAVRLVCQESSSAHPSNLLFFF